MLSFLLLPLASAEPITYSLDPQKSWLFVVVRNDWDAFASRLGHDHGVKATDFQGTVTWDPSNPAACQVSIDVPVSALRPDPPGMRERAGLDPGGAVGEGSLETIRNNFLGSRQLDSEHFPTIQYRSSSCTASGSRFRVSGTLTIHGVGVPITTEMDITADATSFAAKGGFESTHSAFGFGPFTNLGGTLRNLDRLQFTVDVVGAPK